ncbi:hypothetical protein C8J56DRAFT_1043379 [Mycena floridula]|nr:hypothetical protein C8J56DRAFT_1043379 [Mycena floridula]
MSGSGRQASDLYTANFTRLELRPGKSRRYDWSCNHCTEGSETIEGRDNKLAIHLSNPKACPNAPSSVREAARVFLMGKAVRAGTVQIVKSTKKRKSTTTLDSVVDYPLTEAQLGHILIMNEYLYTFIVHANIPFAASENWYFHAFLDELRPSYPAPSRYVLSHTLMDSEVAWVQTEEIAQLQGRRNMTLILDDWEDKLRRSLYGTIAAEVGNYPVVLSVEDVTGFCGSADEIFEVADNAMATMEIKNALDPKTDDPAFLAHAREVFNRRFHAMNTPIHSLALFVHPLCRKLAITDAAHDQTLDFMLRTALSISWQWKWSLEDAKKLKDDITNYHLGRAPFKSGVKANGLEWWESLPVKRKRPSTSTNGNHNSLHCSSFCRS